jgi:hypothetical protein
MGLVAVLLQFEKTREEKKKGIYTDTPLEQNENCQNIFPPPCPVLLLPCFHTWRRRNYQVTMLEQSYY